MAQASIDVLAPKKSLIDLGGAHNDSLDGIIDQDYELGFIFDGHTTKYFTPEVGHFYIFEASHQHFVMPFKSVENEIRRSMSFNFIRDNAE